MLTLKREALRAELVGFLSSVQESIQLDMEQRVAKSDFLEAIDSLGQKRMVARRDLTAHEELMIDARRAHEGDLDRLNLAKTELNRVEACLVALAEEVASASSVVQGINMKWWEHDFGTNLGPTLMGSVSVQRDSADDLAPGLPSPFPPFRRCVCGERPPRPPPSPCVPVCLYWACRQCES